MYYFKNNPFIKWLIWCMKLLKLLFQNKGKHLKLHYLSYANNCTFGIYNTLYDEAVVSKVRFDDFIYVGHRTKIHFATIGKFCSIGSDVRIGLGKHPVNHISNFPAFYSTQKQGQITFVKENYYNEFNEITIGNDVWIGSNAIILDNVIIGDGAIISAGAVVVKDVEPYSIVGGVPAKVIKMRFNEKEVKQLLDFQWWNKDIEWILKNHKHFSDKDDFLLLINNQ